MPIPEEDEKEQQVVGADVEERLKIETGKLSKIGVNYKIITDFCGQN
jgi:hypothetical protein